MNARLRTPLRLAAWATVGVLGLGIAAGAAEAVTSQSRPAPAATGSVAATAAADLGTAARPTPGRAGALLRRTVHGEVVVRTKAGFRTIAVQRGKITGVGPGTITVTSADKFVRTYTLGTDTKVRLDRAASTAGALKTDYYVAVVATKTGDTYQARRVIARTTPPANAART